MSFRIVLTTVSMKDRVAFERMCTNLSWLAVAYPEPEKEKIWRIQTKPLATGWQIGYTTITYDRVAEKIEFDSDIGSETLISEILNVHYVVAVYQTRLEIDGFDVSTSYNTDGHVVLKATKEDAQMGLEIGGGVI